jgi:3',5'-cyclic AMP phosphodiesterase CpdA
MDRRDFLTTTLAGTTLVALPATCQALDDAKPLRIGLIADVHQDVMHDAEQRLQVFIDEMKRAKVDFLLQLGDFCIPVDSNKPFLDIWNSYSGPRYHVLGNHDMDGKGEHPKRFRPEETVEYWGMPHRYYSFETNGIHIIVLDGNDQGPGQKPYYRYIGDEQLAWFGKQLDQTRLPTIVFVHQSPERPNQGGLENGVRVRKVMQEANRRAGWQQVIACFSGHHHRDYMRRINNILYSQINSASYYWIGSKFQHVRYSEQINKQYPNIKNTVPYKSSLFATVSIDLRNKVLAITGRESEFVGPSPWKLGADKQELEAASLVPKISNWKTPW